MIGIDTNVLVRLLTEDDETQVEKVHRLLEPLDSIAESVLIDDIVLVETLWVLRRRYGRSKDDLIAVVQALLSTLTFKFEDQDVLARALGLFERHGADFSDCLIVARNNRAGCDHTATLDRAMGKLEGVKVL